MCNPLSGLVDRCTHLTAREATLQELLAVHHPSLIDDIQMASEAAGGETGHYEYLGMSRS